MRKLILAVFAAHAWLGGLSVARAETIWYQGWGDRFDYNYRTSYQYTSVQARFGVWPVAYGHSAGVVFTDDGWATVNWKNAEWVANVPNPYGGRDESWKVFLLGGRTCQTFGCSFTPFTFEFALYVQNAQGQWFWDNNHGFNHRIDL